MNTQSYAWSYSNYLGYNILIKKINLFEDPKCPGSYPLYANCTTKEPPEDKDGYIICFNTLKDDWEYIENHFGEIGFLNGEDYIVSNYGPLPDGFTKDIPIEKAININIKRIKNICKQILDATDYLLMPDYPIGVEEKNKIIEFRAKIRNLDKEDGYPWPNQNLPIPKWPIGDVKKCPYNIEEIDEGIPYGAYYTPNKITDSIL